MQEILINAGTTLHLFEFFDQIAVPAGVYNTKILIVDEQWYGIEPLEKLIPLVWMGLELFQSFPDQTVMSGVVLTQEGLPLPGRARVQ